MEYIIDAFRKYAVFTGRASRKQYWMFGLMFLLYFFVIGFALALLGGLTSQKIGSSLVLVVMGILGLSVLATVIPSISIAVRRLHDTDRSGWWYFISFVPYIGGIVLLVFMCLKGTTGPNRFGPDPYGGATEAAIPPQGPPTPTPEIPVIQTQNS